MGLLLLVTVLAMCGSFRQCRAQNPCATAASALRDTEDAPCTVAYTVVVDEANETSLEHFRQTHRRVCQDTTCTDLTRNFLTQCFPQDLARVSADDLDYFCQRSDRMATDGARVNDYCGIYRDNITTALMDCGDVGSTLTTTSCGPDQCNQRIQDAYATYGCCITEYLRAQFSRIDDTTDVVAILSTCGVQQPSDCNNSSAVTENLFDNYDPILREMANGMFPPSGPVDYTNAYFLCTNNSQWRQFTLDYIEDEESLGMDVSERFMFTCQDSMCFQLLSTTPSLESCNAFADCPGAASMKIDCDTMCSGNAGGGKDLQYYCGERTGGSQDYCAVYTNNISMTLEACGNLINTLTDDVNCNPGESCVNAFSSAAGMFGCCLSEYVRAQLGSALVTDVGSLLSDCDIGTDFTVRLCDPDGAGSVRSAIALLVSMLLLTMLY